MAGGSRSNLGHITDERGTSVPHVQATGTENVQDKVSDWEFPMILNCESDFSRIRRVPLEYVLEIPCMIVTIRNSSTESRNSACRTGVSRNVHFILVKIV